MDKNIIELPKKEPLRPAWIGFVCTCGLPIAVISPVDNSSLFMCTNCNRQFTVSIMMHSIQLTKPIDNPIGGPNG